MASLYKRNSSNIWWVRFQLNGKRVQRSTGTSKKSQALRVLARLMEEERQRQEQGYKRVRFGVLCEEYCKQHLPLLKPATRVGYLGHIQVLKASFGEDRYIDEVRKVHIAEFVGHLKKTGLKPPTIRRYLGTQSSLFSFAERSGWLAQNPVRQFDKRSLPEALPRTRFLSQAEYRRMAVETGMRLEELLGLRWDQVHLERREVRLVVTKSNRPRVIPLSDRAVAILAASPRIATSPYVFINPQTGNRYRSLRQSFCKACSRAGIRISAGMTCGTPLPVGMCRAGPTFTGSAEC